ncbi:MAG: 30S ribosomal protein S7, partial [Bacteroidales bacterium]|nr:30S ribosomal protein S7 [Bacteroidales bacterium]
NNMMLDGKKSISYDIFYGAMDLVEARTKEEGKTPLEVFKQGLDNITPQVEVKSRRVGGATFQVPMEVRNERKMSIAMKNMIMFARKRPGKSMAEKLAGETIAAYNNEGGAYKKKEDTHRMAEANKAFAHFRF